MAVFVFITLKALKDVVAIGKIGLAGDHCGLIGARAAAADPATT